MKTFRQNVLLFLFLLPSFFAAAQVPVLNSYPASTNVIFLDFDGHVVEGTSWNSSGALVCDPSNLDAAQITTVFNRVAEDYRPFTVNVTTDSAKYYAAPADRRMRVVLTTSSSWFGSAGGVAYMNSFTWGDNSPCFVFTALLNYNTKNVAEAASHEVGHTLGLRHQSAYDAVCNKLSEYNSGKGSGEIGWAPIMGVGYYQNMTLWNYGANPYGCANYQDDLSVITGNGNGISFRNDDHGNTGGTATLKNFINNSFSTGGIIERPNDEDAIRFTMAAAGRFKANVLPYSVAGGNTGANVDLEVELLDHAENVVGVYNPATLMGTSIDTALLAGTYYLRVRGRGNIYAPNYASLGSYTINATLVPGNPLAVHKLQLAGMTVDKKHKLDWEIAADEKVVSQVLEAATDGSSFKPLADLDATVRTYHHLPATSVTYYRMAITFDNERRNYSNIVALRSNGSNAKPYLLAHITTGTLRISSPGKYAYCVFDLTGRVVSKGALVQGMNTVSPHFSTSGLYIIQFTNGQDMFTEKFSKQ